MRAVGKTLTKVGKAGVAVTSSSMSAPSLSRMGTDAAALQSAAQTAQADPPPVCVPGLRNDSGTAEADFTQVGQGDLDAVQAMQNGSLQTALSDMNAVNGTLGAGTTAMRKATGDITAFTGG